VRVPPVALTLMDRVRAWKHDTDLGNRLTGQAVGVLGRDAVLTIIGLQNCGNLPDCGSPTREQFPGRVLTEGRAAVIETAEAASQIPPITTQGSATKGAGPAWRPGPASSTLPARRHYAGIRGARHWVMAWPAASYGVVAAGGLRGEGDEQA